MLSTVYSATVGGIDGFEVTVECSTRDRAGPFELVGMGDIAVKEAKERVRCACENSGYYFPKLEVMVNLAPANLKKEGSSFDLAILTAIMQCGGLIPREVDLSASAFVGELSLSGEVRAIDGVLCMASAAKAAGRREIFVPLRNVAEASILEGITVYGVPDFRSLVEHLCGREALTPAVGGASSIANTPRESLPDFSDVKGQETAKRAMEVAAAGGHHILLIGPPGTGKSMLAKRLPSILPEMSWDEMIEVTKIYSVSGNLRERILFHRPFRAPHHSVTVPGLVGGGTNPRPGEISLAHHGVLFLDEFPEFPKSAIEAMRQPLEDCRVTITRAGAKCTYPSAFMLVAAMNPCKCGYFGDPNRRCTCKYGDVQKYISKISGPMLDRMDMQVELGALTYAEMAKQTTGEASAVIRDRVARARAIAGQRFAGEKHKTCNAHMESADLRRYCTLTEAAESMLHLAFDRLGMSARGHDRILKVARTIADLEEAEVLNEYHIAEALSYRSLDKKYWRT